MIEEPVDLIMIGGDPVAAIPAAGGADQYAALTKQVYLEPELAVVNIKAGAVQLRQQARASDDVLPANVKRQHPQEGAFQTGGEAVCNSGEISGVHSDTFSRTQRPPTMIILRGSELCSRMILPWSSSFLRI